MSDLFACSGKEPESQNKSTAFAVGMIFLLAVSCFAKAVAYDLVWDDVFLVNYVKGLYGEGGLLKVLTSEFRLDGPYGYFRPIVLLHFLADSLAGDGASVAAHVTNILLHGANSVLFFILALRMGAPLLGAVFSGALFAVHPIHIESVVFVSGRTDLWACFFILLSGIFRFGCKDKGPGMAQPLLSGMFLLLACLSKEAAYLAPFVWLVADFDPDLKKWLRRNAAYLAFWVLALLTVLVSRQLAGVGFGVGGGAAFDMGQTIGKILEYIRMLAWPWPHNPLYTPEQVAVDLSSVLSLLFLAGVCLFLGKNRLALVGILWLLVYLLPVSGIVPIRLSAPVAERFLYIPSIGFALLVGCALGKAAGLSLQAKKTVTAFVALVCICFFAASQVGAKIWSDYNSLFAGALEVSPKSDVAHHNLGHSYLRRGELKVAEELFMGAVELNNNYCDAHFNLGITRGRMGDMGGAVDAFEDAAECRPGWGDAYYNIGVAKAAMGLRADALKSYEMGVARDPYSINSRVGLIKALAMTPRRNEIPMHIEFLEQFAPAEADKLRKMGYGRR